MLTPEEQTRLNKITEVIIGCAFHVHNVLKDGYLEKVYENALAHDLRKAGLNFGSSKVQVKRLVRDF